MLGGLKKNKTLNDFTKHRLSDTFPVQGEKSGSQQRFDHNPKLFPLYYAAAYSKNVLTIGIAVKSWTLIQRIAVQFLRQLFSLQLHGHHTIMFI